MSDQQHDGFTLRETLHHTQACLAQAGIDQAVAEARLLLAHVLGLELSDVAKASLLGDRITGEQYQRLTSLVDRRIQRVPLQHLTGAQSFYGVSLRVGPGVFIPRPETEALVELAQQLLTTRDGDLTVLDLCSGSGAIAVALEHHWNQQTPQHREHSTHKLQVIAVEKDPVAVRYLQTNTHATNITTVCADATDVNALLIAHPGLREWIGHVDLVVANPPYVPEAHAVVQPEAAADPPIALYGGNADGTAIPLAVATTAAQFLAPGGWLVMEHDASHADRLRQLASEQGMWQTVTTLSDYNDRPRFLKAHRVDSKTHPCSDRGRQK
ncbi:MULTISPECIES: peptide chain release factor N(5)-glutamine methyltransferase [Auritidibacter]|uniref:peptide chain release factor N(5)-glutamine methyltransferase n=1 Tax=Auritidibacter TaxID=1160973 RepID=UPI000D73AF8D|nr:MULTISPECIES: peptide chain release factor N(5)-glutamine methyltransferase [Auritidibacter]NIH71014.1 release factor glutamine methyltransferase [Auritidibacter ignavus]PXA77506.1 peptide chain release factor N(5)-glutamine methyltransferase [Auritidibacter sp. NML100628]PXA81982.1 peptide chain release factor N(5)-glutamine methyltransferase [Auritidibacter sp. NML120636]RMX24172.1 peptide chain release factor N(5)-glutamine methyltransferase [Auritidibacter ignavus]WGH81783.1 peptide cha